MCIYTQIALVWQVRVLDKWQAEALGADEMTQYAAAKRTAGIRAQGRSLGLQGLGSFTTAFSSLQLAGVYGYLDINE